MTPLVWERNAQRSDLDACTELPERWSGSRERTLFAIIVVVERSLTRDQSWTHRLAADRAQQHFLAIQRAHAAGEYDPDSLFIRIAEYLYWVTTVDEGFSVVLRGMTSPTGASYKDLRARSEDGQHVLAARWARNKITHCLARPIHDEAGRLGETLVLGSSTLGPDLRWLTLEAAIAKAIDADRHEFGSEQYDKWFAGQPVYPTLIACFRWFSTVRYDYRDPNYARNWFSHQA